MNRVQPLTFIARTAAASARVHRPTAKRLIGATESHGEPMRVDVSTRLDNYLAAPPLRWAQGATESHETPKRMNDFAKKPITFDNDKNATSDTIYL